MGLYYCLREPPILTVIMGAKCVDGIVLVTDKKMTAEDGTFTYCDKIFGDLSHIIMGYTGWERTFDIFRKYIVGDLVINRDSKDRYTFSNYIPVASKSVKRFDKLVVDKCKHKFEVLIAKHQYEKSELHYINVDGTAIPIPYKAIGSGQNTADMHCGKLDHKNITMKYFVKRAYYSILYMDKFYPDLGVGIEDDDHPCIRYLENDKDLDREAPKDDKIECREYAINKLKEWNEKESDFLKD
jgi:20S proteasome alpha/beta subunit